MGLKHTQGMELLEDFETGECAMRSEVGGKIAGHTLDSVMREYTPKIIVAFVKEAVDLVGIKSACSGTLFVG